MTAREAKFVSEYVKLGNGTQAAIRAGYSERCANRQAYKLLRRAEIRAAIDERLAQISTEQIAQTQEVMEYLTRVLRGEEKTVVVVASGKKIEIPAPIAERIKAAHLLLKIYGAYQREVNVQVSAADKFIAALEESYRIEETACAELNTVNSN